MILYPKAHFNNVNEISIEFLEKNNIFDENAKKAILDEWVTNVRLKN